MPAGREEGGGVSLEDCVCIHVFMVYGLYVWCVYMYMCGYDIYMVWYVWCVCMCVYIYVWYMARRRVVSGLGWVSG